jgi:hypothetical protein
MEAFQIGVNRISSRTTCGLCIHALQLLLAKKRSCTHCFTLLTLWCQQARALIQRWAEQYGDAYTIKLRTLWLVLSDPKDVKVSTCAS